jgi:hypothetical protein
MPAPDDRAAAPRRRLSARTIILFLLTLILSLRLWYGDGSRPGLCTRLAFAAQVRAHFAEWDRNHDGFLTVREVGALVPDVRIRYETAAALAAIHAVQRAADPRTRDTAFRRHELIRAALGDLIWIDVPPFST